MIETVKIVKKNHAGFAIINKSDFDPEKHELYGVEKHENSGPTVKEIVEELKALGVEIPKGSKKEDMLALLAKAKQE